MRKSVIGRALIVGAFIITTFATGCSSSDDSSSETTSSAKATSTSASAAATTSAAASAAETQAITDAYITFFNGTTAPATRAALLENGEVFLPTLEAMAADPQSMATTATVEGVTAAGADNASVKWTLVMGGTPVLPDQSGEAVQEAGTWKVSATTYCTLMAIQGSGATVPGC
ncbi:hypothetical protein FFI94_016090 [Rhodococcus sp. KBS0724]|jgi:hypothetical protein|uniref:hypothetical protein n=1 Tax=Rhodococcus sp. KBS0724 TaxID=1179674 RepID=UPI00110E567A|nr:hypothetical protein [Rhodococcus sp. KBS0724]TSD47510.1 hypothetical protein FFI94_016090 [Rhodococcus sp. KBS0724]